MPAHIQTLPKGDGYNFKPMAQPETLVPGCFFWPQPYAGRIRIAQVTLVIVHPQRGQSDPVPERQVVPQCEQVLADVRGFATLPQT